MPGTQFRSAPLALCVALLAAACAPVSSQNQGIDSRAAGQTTASNTPSPTTVVTYSRHTFRGISEEIAPVQINVGPLSNFVVPTYGYEMDATPAGLRIARTGASPALALAAANAAKSAGGQFDNSFEHVRTDFATERTVMTAAELRTGLVDQSYVVGPVSGVPTKPQLGIDPATSTQPVMKCMPPAELAPEQNAGPGLARLKEAGEKLLGTVGEVLGRAGTYTLPEPVVDSNGKLQDQYDEVAYLASAIEMAADLGSPISIIFRSDRTELGQRLVTESLEYVGLHEVVIAPGDLAAAEASTLITFLDESLNGSSDLMAVSHDSYISAMTRALGIITENAPAAEYAMYPIETFAFAKHADSVAVTRMRIDVASDGSMPGTYSSKTAWEGSAKQWADSVAHAQARAQSVPVGLSCRSKVTIPEAVPLNLELQR